MSQLHHTVAWLRAILAVDARDERGFSVTSETVWIVVGVVTIAGIAVAFLSGFVQELLGRL